MTKTLLGILAITSTLACEIKAQSFLTNGLVAYYPFNGNADDATGNSNNGQIIGNVVPATDRFGNASNAYHFDGINAGIQVTNALVNIGQPEYTISGWFSFDDVSHPLQQIFNSIPETGFGEGPNGGGSPEDLQAGIGPALPGTWTVIPILGLKSNYVDDAWYQIIFTKSGTTYTSYIDSQVDWQVVVPAAAGYNSNVGCWFGAVGSAGNYAVLEGRLDDFRVYNRALSSNEIQQLYAYESAPPCALPSPAIATATVTNGFVIAATVTDGGCGYTNTPLVLIVGGGGEGATATALVTNGVVVGVTITDAGIGYTSAPTVYIYSPLGVQIGILQAVIPTFSSLSIGSNYQLQASGDLTTWTNQGSAFTATNPTMTYPQYINVSSWNQLFFRLQAAP